MFGGVPNCAGQDARFAVGAERDACFVVESFWQLVECLAHVHTMLGQAFEAWLGQVGNVASLLVRERALVVAGTEYASVERILCGYDSRVKGLAVVRYFSFRVLIPT